MGNDVNQAVEIDVAVGQAVRLSRRWKLLHRLVYLTVPLSILHYFWVERDIRDWVVILFVVRPPAMRRAIARRCQQPQMIVSENKN